MSTSCGSGLWPRMSKTVERLFAAGRRSHVAFNDDTTKTRIFIRNGEV
jgi:hypothetical protein